MSDAYKQFISDLKHNGVKAFETRGIKLAPQQFEKLNKFKFQAMSFEELEQQFNRSKFDSMMKGGFFTFF